MDTNHQGIRQGLTCLLKVEDWPVGVHVRLKGSFFFHEVTETSRLSKNWYSPELCTQLDPPCSHRADYKPCCIHLKLKVLSRLYFPFLCLLLCYMYHITVGEGHRCGEEEADGYEVGRSALLKLMQSRWDSFWELNAKQILVTTHTRQQTAELWKMTFFGHNAEQYISWCTLLYSLSMSMTALVPSVLKGTNVACSITSSSYESSRSVYRDRVASQWTTVSGLCSVKTTRVSVVTCSDSTHCLWTQGFRWSMRHKFFENVCLITKCCLWRRSRHAAIRRRRPRWSHSPPAFLHFDIILLFSATFMLLIKNESLELLWVLEDQMSLKNNNHNALWQFDWMQHDGTSELYL